MENNEDKKSETISMFLRKKDPKPDAPRYEFRTVEEIFGAINSENIDRFLADFDTGFRAAISLRDALNGIVESLGETAGQETLKLDTFTWIDD